MPNLTRWSLYELEQIAKRKGYDIDRLRNLYWDEMVSSGLAETEGSVRREALKSRVFEEPVEAPEQEAPWYEKILSPAGSKIREASLEGLAVGLPTMTAKAGEFFRDIPAAAGRLAGEAGWKGGEELLSGSSELIEDELQKIREKAAQAPISRPESMAFRAAAGVPAIGGDILKMAPYLTAMGPIAGFAAAEGIPAYAEGAPIGEVAKEAGKGAALGAGFELASMLPLIYRLPAMGAVSAAAPAIEGAPPSEILAAAGLGSVLSLLGPSKGARFKERIKGKPESKIVDEAPSKILDVTPEEEALAALKGVRPEPTVAPPIEPIRTKPREEGLTELIEKQDLEGLSRRAAAANRTVEEQIAFETKAQARQKELDVAEIEGRPPNVQPEQIQPKREPILKQGRITKKLSDYTDDELEALQDLAEGGQIRNQGAAKAIEKEILARRSREARRIVTPEEIAQMEGSAGPVKPEVPIKPGERGFVTLDFLIPMRSKKAQASKAVDDALVSAGAKPTPKPYEQRANNLLREIDDIGSILGLSKREEILLNEAETVGQTGTLSKGVREEFRSIKPKPQGWYNMKFSVKDIDEVQRRAPLVARELKDLQIEAAKNGDVATLKALKLVRQKWHGVTNEFSQLRKASGESVRKWQLAPKYGDDLELIANTLDDITRLNPRDPIYTEIKELVKKGVREGGLETPERQKLTRDLVDAWRLNLFSVSSFTLDLMGNLAALGSESAGWLAEDAWRAMTLKDPSFVNIRSAIKGIRKGVQSEARAGALPESVQTALGRKTASGEFVGGRMFGEGPGTFTTRSNFISKKIDQMVGAPLYMKGAVDTGFKRMGAWAQLYKDAEIAAKRAGKTGAQRKEYIDAWIQAADETTVARAVNQANKLGFNRQLSAIEEEIASNTMYKLFGAAFGRWPFQFTRALGEWTGLNLNGYRALKAGNMDALANYIGKSAAGLGGMKLLADTMYDNMDFKTMEYVHPETGNRTRISGREPLATAMVLTAAIKGDFGNVQDSIKYASLPFASIAGGEGGLAWNLVLNLQKTMKMRDMDPKAMEKEVIKTFNRLIPGQALLAAVKTVFDPVAREGIGAELPGISMLKPEKVDPTTGEPYAPKQRIPGLNAEIPQIAGVPIPGAQRILDPVSQLLGSYGMLDYRMPRRPVVGIPAANIPPEMQRRWYELLGTERSRIFKVIAPALLAKRKEVPYNTRLDLIDRYKNYERLLKGGAPDAAKQAFGDDWKKNLVLAKQLQEDKKTIQKKDSEAVKAALLKLESEMRRARREGRL